VTLRSLRDELDLKVTRTEYVVGCFTFVVLAFASLYGAGEITDPVLRSVRRVLGVLFGAFAGLYFSMLLSLTIRLWAGDYEVINEEQEAQSDEQGAKPVPGPALNPDYRCVSCAAPYGGKHTPQCDATLQQSERKTRVYYR